MKKTYLFAILFLIFFSSNLYTQSITLGIRLESFAYSIHHPQTNSSDLEFWPIPLSGYLKAGVNFFEKYELEVKTGVQLIDPFTGFEYAIGLKYYILKNISPVLTYLNHINSGDSRNAQGTYNSRMEFIGLGIEAKLTKIFNVDLIYYIPVGNKNLEYEIVFPIESMVTSEIGPMVKLGFIFNIVEI